MPNARYHFGIDFDNDGDVTRPTTGLGRLLGSSPYDQYEYVSDRVRQDPPVSISRGRDQARELSPPRAGSLSFTLDNSSGDYSQENSASPVFGKMIPGVFVQVQAEYPAGTIYDLFTGYLDVPDENPYRNKKLVTVKALDGLSKLRASKVSTAMYTSIRTDQAIGYVLDAAGWPAGKRILATGQTTLARWWVGGQDAFSAIRDIVQSEGPGAIFYCDASGNVVFEDRHYRLLTSRSTTSQATVRGAGTEPVFKRYTYVGGLRGIVNDVTIPVRSYTVASLAPVWTGPTPISLAAGETRKYTVSATSGGFTAAVAPVAGTDYTLSGTALASATLDRTSGQNATLTLVAGADACTITGLQVRAQAVTYTTQDVKSTVDASASQAAYGPRSLDSDFIPPWVPDVSTAQDFCNAIVARYKDKVPQVSFSLTNGDATALVQALSRQVSDRVTVAESSSGVNGDFIIEAVETTVNPPNQETLFYAEKASDQAYWVLGVAGYSELGSTTTLGY